MIFHRTDWQHVDDAPLTQRAWTVQEKYLAPRVLRFTEKDIIWQCFECIKVEAIPVSFDTRSMMHSIIKKSAWNHSLPAHQREQTAYQLWHELVMSYTACSLTFMSNRPIAISGLAGVFSGMLNLPEKDYLCGLWRPRLVHGIMWHAASWPTPPEVLRIPGLPSWSWMSLCSAIWQSPGIMHGGEWLVDKFSTVDILEAFTVPLGDPFGPVSVAELTLRAPLCQVKFMETHDSLHDEENPDGTYCMLLGEDVLRQQEHFTFRPDDYGPDVMLRLIDLPVYLMLGRAHKLEPEHMALNNTTVESDTSSR